MGYGYNPEWKRGEGVALLEVPSGQAVRAIFGELRDISYWNPISGQYQSTPPTFAIYHWGGMGCEGVNLTDENQRISLHFYTYDPNNDLVDIWTSPLYTIKPGEGLLGSHAVYCEIPGAYKMRCELYMEGLGVVARTDTLVTCYATGVAELKAVLASWWQWDYETGSWVSVSPTLVPLGGAIS
ncbi:hypothetical protein ES703_116338 [subsurface metagenome]